MILGTPGDSIANRYLLLKPLGSGGFGQVWKARDSHLNQVVALKLIRNGDPGATWHEASLLTALRSEHILEVNNADVFQGITYLDTALAACSTDQRAQPLGVEPGLAVDWMRRALRGLDLCHKRGLLHRDVKPQNIFLALNGDAKLGDFGVAAHMDEAGTAEAHGDLRVWAPELFTGGRASIRSDVYSAACTLYALVAGGLPFDGIRQQIDLEAAIAQGSYIPVRDRAPHVSSALADKIKRGMALDPAERFPTAASFDSALALPSQSRRFIPKPPHDGHLRCWAVAGPTSALRVCIIAGTGSACVSVETRYEGSGNRVTQHCFGSTEADLPKRLRAVFNNLRLNGRRS
ncbi:serine/threonine-protein kinase [Nocardia brasiliensis]|uniref:non-specific serine/threonine protein kinase n=1 Tax=Nocardia brasiliensis (strain ATCC 700358 / HUJEG-1) TaxID=1133849 RepID=K0F924_NOCB7|nr:serine/threonine-protein kinase [Nocardia brasiliensis]AFU06237.1 serine/threonine kinase protein [Nocardia brasiliensis ATCC 700358]